MTIKLNLTGAGNNTSTICLLLLDSAKNPYLYKVIAKAPTSKEIVIIFKFNRI